MALVAFMFKVNGCFVILVPPLMCGVSCLILGLRCGNLLSLNFSPYIDIVLICFHILVIQEYGVLIESRIPLQPVLGGERVVARSISSHEQTSLLWIAINFLILHLIFIGFVADCMV